MLMLTNALLQPPLKYSWRFYTFVRPSHCTFIKNWNVCL